ncbi:MAG: hypothetical protein QOK40_744, partial [Miltoncostaeaceae bacterium]|nr:hypothetical protein [Miltoncostaeaceae bacterium]
PADETARAIRRLKPDSVPVQLLDDLVRAASRAPTGANRQAFSFVVVTDRRHIARLAGVWRDASAFYLDTLSREVGPREGPPTPAGSAPSTGSGRNSSRSRR